MSSRYQSLELIGSGAMGSVYRAFDILLDRQVAIKVLSAADASPNEVEYFKQEFQTVADLDHPNLVKVYDFGQTPSGELFYSMESMSAGPLDSLPRPLGRETLIPATVQLCRALQYIHSKGIIHRDLKPANVMCQDAPEDDQIRVKLTDFGLASLPKDTVPTSPHGGTPAYAAPEILAQGTVDFRADLFSLGVMIYELSTGELPFSWQGGSIGRIRPPSSINEELPREMDTLVLKLLEFDASNRYRDANAVIEAMNHLFGKKLAAETEKTSVSYVLSPALVGRDEELRAIKRELSALANVRVLDEVEDQDVLHAAAVAQAEGGAITEPSAGVLLISGPTGIGKTRLVQEAKLFCQLNGIAFCQGQSVGGSLMAGAPVIEAVGSLLSGLPAEKTPKLPPALAQLVGSGRRRTEGPGFTDSSSFAESVYQFLKPASKVSPLVLCIDDIQYADPVTLSTLAYLARGLFLTALEEPTYEVPCRILVTVDDTGTLSKEHKALLKELRESPYTTGLTPASLTADGIAQVVASMFGPQALPEGAAQRLHRATAGLPLFLQQLMAQLLHTGVISQEMGHWKLALSDLESVSIPEGTKDRTNAVLAGLTPAERKVLETMSILTLESDSEGVSALTGLPYPQVRYILGDLSRRALLDQRRDMYSLAPGPLRTSVYGSLHWSKRRRLHLEAAKSIEKKKIPRRARVHALAHHYLAAKDKDGSLKWGLAAARDSAKSQANLEAAAYYKQILKLGLDRADSPEILCEYGKCLAVTGFQRRAIRVFMEAYNQSPRTRDPLRTELQKLIGDILIDSSDLNTGRLWLRKAAKNQAAAPTEAIGACTALVFLELNAGRPAEVDKYLDQARRGIEATDCGSSMKSLVNRTIGMILADRGELSGAFAHLRAALKYAREAKDLEAESRSYGDFGVLYHRQSLHARSLRASSISLDIARKMSDPATVALQLMNIGAVRYDRGEYTSLTRDLLEACSLFRRAGSLLQYSLCLSNLALTAIQLGQYERAFKYIHRSASIQAEQGYHVYAIISRSSMATALIHTGQIEEALRVAKKNLSEAVKARISRQVYMARKSIAEAFFLKGQTEEARALLREALEGFRSIGEKDEVCECMIELATLEEAAGRMETAYSLSSEAGQIASTLGSRPIQLKAAISTTPRYAREVKRIRRLASIVESPELRWRAHASCARYFVHKGNLDQAIEQYSDCISVFRSVAADFKDPGLKEAYLNHPEREGVLKAIRELRKSAQ